jgi:hypothetical protein
MVLNLKTAKRLSETAACSPTEPTAGGVRVRLLSMVLLAVAAFAVLAVAINRQPSWGLLDFDQSFYTTIAYDLDQAQ